MNTMQQTKALEALKAWSSIPIQLRRAVAASSGVLDRRGGSEDWSVREYVHHIVEANLVACTIILAAVGSPGSIYDWSWVTPDRRWMKRVGYDKMPVDTSIAVFRQVVAHVSAIMHTTPSNLRREVWLYDSKDETKSKRTVMQVLTDEYEHAQHHLNDIASIRKIQRRVRRSTGA